MKLKFENNFIGYFKFYYSILGNRFILNLVMGVVVSFLDGLGLAMFIPLLQSVGGDAQDKKDLGKLHYIVDFLDSINVPLTINVVLIMLVVLFVVKGLLKYVQLSYQVKLWHLFMRKIRYSLLETLQGLNFAGFAALETGKVQNTLTAETQKLYQTIRFYFNAAQAAVMLITYIGLAFYFNFQFALMVAVGAGISNLFYKKIYTTTKKSSIGVSKKGNEFNSLLAQAVHHFKYLKSTNYFSRFAVHLRNVIKGSEALNRKMGMNTAITASMKEPMIIVIVTLVIYLQLNYMGASLASILLSLLLFYRALSFLIVIQNFWQSFIQNVGAIDSVTTLMNDMSENQEEIKDKKYIEMKKGIFIRDVEFGYGDIKVLDKISIDFHKNQTLAFVGESGSGKSTLANLIAGLIKPQSGNIYLDDELMSDYSIESFRNKIGYISQEPVVFADTIFNNVTFWAEPTEENKMKFWDAIEMASLTSFIHLQPNKENTMLGDNGLLISGGQKQRISIARELFKDIELLILDEATSALDSETERIIQNNIEKLHGKYSIILIAHRLSTIKEADTIFLLEKGKVAASGSFAEMIENSERFKRMVSLQDV